ncbi:hypothetical protein Zm00014a_024097 [Zea mays]|uniref:DUF4283 domain-containing protein n=1 Tax=Zea mays TaxID=4577 RepID=A0A3L6F8J5_MAIZE|nr:hypothetical protein Zm00014a_024097 [Zea mays]
MVRYDRPSSSYGFLGGTCSRKAVNLPAIPSLNSAGVPGTSSVDTLAQAVALLSQALGQSSENLAVLGASKTVPDTGGKTDVNAIINNGEGTSSAQVGAGKHAQKETSGKQPYCYRCLTKGHTTQGCTTKLFCDICRTKAHNSGRCPVFRGDKPGALTCGYAVDGLGFYYIPHDPWQENKDYSLSALVRVTSGSLSQEQIVSELGRLVSSKWNWEIVKTGPFLFKTLFPSREHLAQMIEWGVVQTKFNASMKIEEGVVAKKANGELKKVWIQFIEIPLEMMNFLLIWAVGSTLGVTKVVDMKFTIKFEVGRMQVSVLDLNLVPQFVDVVIGDFIYELQLRVEENIDEINLKPMDMDDTGFGEDDKKSEDNGSSKQKFGSLTLEQNKQHAVSTGNRATGSNMGNKVTDQGVQTLLCSQPSVVDTQIDSGKDTSWALVPGSPNVSTMSADLNMADVGILSPEVLALAAVSKANNSAKLLRSKRRAATSMKDSVARATKLKAACNLDSAFAEGTNCYSPLFFPLVLVLIMIQV